MHKHSLQLMQQLLNKYHPEGGEGRLLYDVGSYDVNGTYKDICVKQGWKYVGLDIADGKNVNIVTPNDYITKWYPEIVEVQADLVISGQCMEHTKYPWLWLEQVKTLAKIGAYIFLIVPGSWPEHRHPLDCWRVLPDGFKALGEFCELTLIDTKLYTKVERSQKEYSDTMAVFRVEK